MAAEPPPSGRGFTLLEILLALSILVLLAGVVIMNVPAMQRGHVLEEGALRIETALRMARAEAANKGRRLRLAFDDEAGRFQLLWEPEPLTEPGEFVEYANCPWKSFLEFEGIAVERCEFVGSSAYRNFEDATTAGAGAGADSDRAVITFEPNGSSDSVVVDLAATDAAETRRARIELDGLTGAVSRRVLTLEEIQELEGE